MRSKRVCDNMLGEVLMLLDMIIRLNRLINVWVMSICFRSCCIIVWGDSASHVSGIHGGKRTDWAWMTGRIGVMLADRGVAGLKVCWGCGCVSGNGRCVACFGGFSLRWMVRVSVDNHLSGGASSVEFL